MAVVQPSFFFHGREEVSWKAMGEHGGTEKGKGFGIKRKERGIIHSYPG